MSKEEKINKILYSYKTPFNKSKEDSWDSILHKIDKKEPKIVSQRNYFKLIAVAASFTLLIVFTWVGYLFSFQKVIALNAEQKEIILPDGSTVSINSDSYIKYSKIAWYVKREVELSGEAYFKVKKGKYFTVSTNQGDVSVLGTEFNVFSRNNKFDTKCYEGKVKVETAGQIVTLVRGDAYYYNSKNLINNQYKFNAFQIKDWRSGEFHFDAIKLCDVFEEMERQYNIKIEFTKQIGNRVYSGYFMNIKLSDALSAVCLPMGLDYRISDDRVVIQNAN